MKAFVKKKWFPFVVAATLLFVLVGFLYCIGFRITYPEEFETSWDAISACATWAGVIASFLAVWFAIRVADKQNKISLFEKRYRLYHLCVEYYAIAMTVAAVKTREDVQIAFLGDKASLDDFEETNKQTSKMLYEMEQTKFLFNEKIGLNMCGFAHLLIDVIDMSLNKDKILELQELQHKLRTEIYNPNYLKNMMKMEDFMYLNK